MGQSEAGFRGIAALAACAAVLLPTASFAATCGVRTDGGIWCTGAVPLVAKGSSDEVLTAADALREQTAQAAMAADRAAVAGAPPTPSIQSNELATTEPNSPPPVEAPRADEQAQDAMLVQPAAQPTKGEMDPSPARPATETSAVAGLAPQPAAPSSAADVPGPSTSPADHATPPTKPFLTKFASMFMRWERRAAAAPGRLSSIFRLGRTRATYNGPLLGQNLNGGSGRVETRTGALSSNGSPTASQANDARKSLAINRYFSGDYRIVALQPAGRSQTCPARLADGHLISPTLKAQDQSSPLQASQVWSTPASPPG